MINSLIPKYPSFIIIGIVTVAVGLFMLLASRDALIAVWIDKFFDGETGDGLFKAAQQADQALGHTLTIWFFLGMSFIMLGIGFAIATIVQNLRATGEGFLTAYSSAGVPGAPGEQPAEPWFGRWFTGLMFSGIVLMIFFFLLTLWWDANVLRLVDFQVDGRTSGALYYNYLMTKVGFGFIPSDC